MLTARQLRFIEEYVVSLNATRAAIRAGYSAKTARAIGSQNLGKFEIAAEIARRLERSKERPNQEPDAQTKRLIRQLERIAFSDVSGIFGAKGTIRPSHEWPREAWDGIKSATFSEKLVPAGPDGKRQRFIDRANIKFHDRTAALAALAELHGMIPRTTKIRRRSQR